MMKETDLFIPVRKLLMGLGYDVQGEIGAADVFAKKEEELLIVELKLQITLKLIYQAIERQKITRNVYIAVPASIYKNHLKQNPQFHDLIKLLKLGLITVKDHEAFILIASDSSYVIKHKPTRKRMMEKEFLKRDQHLTLGGTKEKRMTYYRESVLEVAKALYTLKEATTITLKAYTQIAKTSDILADNYDQLFLKKEKGLYVLSPLGIETVEKLLF